MSTMNPYVTFVIGGCRSGKSGFALKEADALAGTPKFFIATALARDGEMEERVARHRKERGDDWQTIEEPLLIHEAIQTHSVKASAIVVDCLTLWVSNIISQAPESPGLPVHLEQLETALKKAKCPVWVVSNEVGLGIVPDNPLARAFRDMTGLVNQRVAELAGRVVMTVAGIGMVIKPGSPQK